MKADRENDKSGFEQSYMELHMRNNKKGGAVPFEIYDCGTNCYDLEVYIDDDYMVAV